MSATEVRAAVDGRLAPSAVTSPAGNEFVIFSKPELGRLSDAHLAAVWDLFAELLGRHEVSVHQTLILTGPELDARGAMQEHYGVINQISRLGRPALTAPAEQALQGTYGEILADATVLGGHQFLADHPDISPYALGILFANADVQRLGPGTYAGQVNVDGTPVVILNGFHPRQLGFFTAEDAVCAFLHCSSPTGWRRLRSDLIGTTDPAKADGASLRGRLFADPAAFGLTSVSYNFNGVHASAGPLEGLAELQRFFADGEQLTDWTFGQALLAAGMTAEGVGALVANPVLEADGQQGTAFDLTEGLDASAAVPLLVGATRLD